MTGRSLNCGPKRGVLSGTSMALNTIRTPGSASAADASIDTMRAWATGSVTSFACSSSGRWMSAT